MTRLNISIISVSGSPSRICPPKKNSLTESWYSVGGPLRCQGSRIKQYWKERNGSSDRKIHTRNPQASFFL